MSKQIQKSKPTISLTDNRKIRTVRKSAVWNFPLQRSNFLWILIGVGAVVLGYILMSTGITQEPAIPDGKWNNTLAVSIAPFLLVIGYCVLIPYGILKLFTGNKEENQSV